MKPPDSCGFGPAKGALRKTPSTTKIILRTAPSAFLGSHLGMYTIYVHNKLFASGGTQSPMVGESLLAAFLYAPP
jgi:hypothetical protein